LNKVEPAEKPDRKRDQANQAINKDFVSFLFWVGLVATDQVRLAMSDPKGPILAGSVRFPFCKIRQHTDQGSWFWAGFARITDRTFWPERGFLWGLGRKFEVCLSQHQIIQENLGKWLSFAREMFVCLSARFVRDGGGDSMPLI
jgi:hypothetical protein